MFVAGEPSAAWSFFKTSDASKWARVLGLKPLIYGAKGRFGGDGNLFFFWCRMATPHEIHEDVDGMKMKIVKCVMIHMVFDWVLYDWIVSNDNGDDWENTWDNNDAIPSSIIKHG